MGRPTWTKEEKEEFQKVRKKHPPILKRVAEGLKPRAKRGRKKLGEAVKKRVKGKRKTKTKRKTTKRRKRKR